MEALREVEGGSDMGIRNENKVRLTRPERDAGVFICKS